MTTQEQQDQGQATMPSPSHDVAPGTTVEKIKADPEARIWGDETNTGHQGDVVIRRLRGEDLEKAVATRKTHRAVDRALARGSRAAHICVGDDVTVWETGKKGVLLIEARKEWALVHTDTKGHKHHPHVMKAGWFESQQQQEATPTGVVHD